MFAVVDDDGSGSAESCLLAARRTSFTRGGAAAGSGSGSVIAEADGGCDGGAEGSSGCVLRTTSGIEALLCAGRNQMSERTVNRNGNERNPLDPFFGTVQSIFARSTCATAWTILSAGMKRRPYLHTSILLSHTL